MSTADPRPATAKPGQSGSNRVRSALLRYRVLAYITGIWLLVLTAEVIAEYIFGVEDLPSWIAVVHGWVYVVYLIMTLDLAVKVRWSVGRTIATMLAGTIPFLSFVFEHRRTKQVKQQFAL